MWEPKTGYCPVHHKEVTIDVKYASGSVIGVKGTQRKIVSDKCDIWDAARTECSNCPIAYGPSQDTP